MKRIYIFTAAFFLMGGVFSANAQDMIVMRNGDIIEAKVTEISSAEIRYKRFDNLDGPIIVISSATVLSIRYENGTVDVINAAEPAQPVQPALPVKSQDPPMDRNKLYFGISAEPAGFLAYGPSFSGEFTKRGFNTQFCFSFPSLGLLNNSTGFGFGMGLGMNYFKYTRFGGFYIGGMFEWNGYPYSYVDTLTITYFDTTTNNYKTDTEKVDMDIRINDFIFALNIGLKFATKSGIYFRAGGSAGLSLTSYYADDESPAGFFWRPDVAFGYAF